MGGVGGAEPPGASACPTHVSPRSQSHPPPHSSRSITSQLIHLILPFFFSSSSLSPGSLLLLFPPPQSLAAAPTGKIPHGADSRALRLPLLPGRPASCGAAEEQAAWNCSTYPCNYATDGNNLLLECRGVSAAAAATVPRWMRHPALGEQVPSPVLRAVGRHAGLRWQLESKFLWIKSLRGIRRLHWPGSCCGGVWNIKTSRSSNGLEQSSSPSD